MNVPSHLELINVINISLIIHVACQNEHFVYVLIFKIILTSENDQLLKVLQVQNFLFV